MVVTRLNLLNLTPCDCNRLKHVLGNSPSASVFHTLEWNQLLTRQFSLNPVLLLATSGTTGGDPLGFYLYYVDRSACLSPDVRFESVYGGPLALDRPGVISALLSSAERLNRKAYFDVWTPAHYDISPLIERGYVSTQIDTSIVDLAHSEETLWARLNKRKRTAIRKALKNNVVIVDAHPSMAHEYYAMIATTFSRAGIPLLPPTFYERVLEDLHPLGMARLFLAQHGGKYIAGAVFLFFRDTVYYWHAAAHREQLDVSPNDLLHWELMKLASSSGYRYYDLVRVEPNVFRA